VGAAVVTIKANSRTYLPIQHSMCDDVRFHELDAQCEPAWTPALSRCELALTEAETSGARAEFSLGRQRVACLHRRRRLILLAPMLKVHSLLPDDAPQLTYQVASRTENAVLSTDRVPSDLSFESEIAVRVNLREFEQDLEWSRWVTLTVGHETRHDIVLRMRGNANQRSSRHLALTLAVRWRHKHESLLQRALNEGALCEVFVAPAFVLCAPPVNDQTGPCQVQFSGVALQQHAVTELVWENQRALLHKWKRPFLPTDRDNLSTRQGKSLGIRELRELACPRGYEWVTPWQLVVDDPTGTDSEGWTYAVDFPAKYTPKHRFVHAVRRRCWMRKRMPIHRHEHAALPFGGVVDGDHTHFNLRVRLPHGAWDLPGGEATVWSDPFDLRQVRTGTLQLRTPGGRRVDLVAESIVENTALLPGVESELDNVDIRRVRFAPRFIVRSEIKRPILLRQIASNEPMRLCEGEQRMWTWPCGGQVLLVQAALEGAEDYSGAFPIDTPASFTLPVPHSVPYYVRVNIERVGSSMTVTLRSATPSLTDADVIIRNETSLPLAFAQLVKGIPAPEWVRPRNYEVLAPKAECAFAWHEPTMPRPLKLALRLGRRPHQGTCVVSPDDLGAVSSLSLRGERYHVTVTRRGFARVVKVSRSRPDTGLNASLLDIAQQDDWQQERQIDFDEAESAAGTRRTSHRVELTVSVPLLAVSLVTDGGISTGGARVPSSRRGSRRGSEPSVPAEETVAGEVVLLSMRNVAWRLLALTYCGATLTECAVDAVQLDSGLAPEKSRRFPTLLRSLPNEGPFLQLRCVHRAVPKQGGYLPFLGCSVGTAVVTLDDEAIFELQQAFAHLADAWQVRAQSGPGDMLRIDLLEMSDVRLRLSFRHTRRSKGRRAQLGLALSEVSDGRLKLSGVARRRAEMTMAALAALLKEHFADEVSAQALSLLGSAGALGNPRALVNSVGAGVYAFFHEPLSAASRPHTLGGALLKGTYSLVHHSVTGLATSFEG
ncbi:MAG: hypothetical protein MHM6MM_007075, partial [Cercozoa sp. M6MM]